MEKWINQIICGDVLEILKQMPDNFVDCIITSPPYWGLRDYGANGQIGLEKTLEEYLSRLLKITNELKRVLKPSGVMFWNHGDCYNGKCLALQNFRLIIRMIDEQGWILRNIIIWYKPNHMPEPVKDRFTRSYEPVFMLVKSQKYWFDLDSVRIPYKMSSIERLFRNNSQENIRDNYAGYTKENFQKLQEKIKTMVFKENIIPMKNPEDFWVIPAASAEKLAREEREGHFAIFPERLVEPMIRCGCPKDGIVLDPFCGTGTTCVVAKKLGRNFIGIELNPAFVEVARKRVRKIIQAEIF